MGGGGEAECDNEFLKARRNLGAGRQRKKRADVIPECLSASCRARWFCSVIKRPSGYVGGWLVLEF